MVLAQGLADARRMQLLCVPQSPDSSTREAAVTAQHDLRSPAQQDADIGALNAVTAFGGADGTTAVSAVYAWLWAVLR
jgi:hypothetical protein